MIVLIVLLAASASCGSTAIKPVKSMSPTIMASMTLRPSQTPSSTFTSANTWTPLPTISPTPRPTLSGTPLTHYGSIPIPLDAISGTYANFQYQFTSKQSVNSISDYYKQNLPSHGWEILFTSTLGGDESNPTEVGFALGEINGSLQGAIIISRMSSEDLTYVSVDIFTTD